MIAARRIHIHERSHRPLDIDINIRSDTDGFLFDSRIDLRNRLDVWIDSFAFRSISSHEVGDRFNPEVDPFPEVTVGKISELQILLRIKARLLWKAATV